MGSTTNLNWWISEPSTVCTCWKNKLRSFANKEVFPSFLGKSPAESFREFSRKSREAVHPGRLTWNIHITHLERKIIWTKPPWLCSMLIFQGVSGVLWPFLFFLPETRARKPDFRKKNDVVFCPASDLLQRIPGTDDSYDLGEQPGASERRNDIFGRNWLWLLVGGLVGGWVGWLVGWLVVHG